MKLLHPSPSRNIQVHLANQNDDLFVESCAIKVRGITSYLNRYQREQASASQALVADSLAILSLKRETLYSADVISSWTERLLRPIESLIGGNTVLCSVPPAVPSDLLSGIQLVALALSKQLDVPYMHDALTRIAPIETSVNRERGNRSIHYESIAANSAVLGKHIVLLDDVLVSGTTLSACSELLLAAGARHIYPFSLAQVCTQGDIL